MHFYPSIGVLVLLVVAIGLAWITYTLWADAMHKARTGRHRWEED